MPKKTNDRHVGACIPFRCSLSTYDAIEKIAISQKKSKAQVIRDLVDAGLVAAGYKEGDDLLKHTLDDTMKPHIERLAAISAKHTHISGAAFFMSIFLLQQLLPESTPLIEEAAGLSRRLGVEYLKLAKDRDLDAFLSSGAKKITGEIPE